MKELDLKKTGKRIQWYRKKLGISQEAMAEAIDCSSTYVSLIETGNRAVSMEVFVVIANALHVSADDLLIDSLETTIMAVNHAFSNLIQDCNDYEKAVLIDVLKATKASLRDHRKTR